MKYTVNALLKIRCSGTESAISRVSKKDKITNFLSVGLMSFDSLWPSSPHFNPILRPPLADPSMHNPR